VIVPDVNLLVDAVDASSPFHRPAHRWWDGVLSSTEAVGLCYPALLGFVRTTTNRRIFEAPLDIDQSLAAGPVG